MSNSTTLMDTISTAQSNKEAVVNALVDALSPAALWGRHASACNLLVWGYYGGTYYTTSAANAIANGTVTLTASTTNYLYANATTGVVSVNTTGFPAGSIPLYTIVTNATTVTSYTDERSYQPSAVGGGGGSGTVTSVAGAGGIESATGAITASGTLRETMLLAGGAVKTAAYTFVTTDRGATLVMNSASAVSQALPTPTGTTLTTNFPTGWFGWIENIGAGVVTLGVPTGLTLDGVTNGTLALNQNTGVGYFTDGTGWYTLRGAASGGGGFTNPMTTAGDMITGGTAGAAQRLGVGANGTVLSVVSGAPAWAAPSASSPCAFSAGNTSTQSLPASTSTTLTGWTAVEDLSGGAMNFSTGVFTAPYTGWYAVSGVFRTASATFAASNQIVGNIVINGVTQMSSYVVVETSDTANWGSAPVAGLFYVLAGQTISFVALQTSSAAVNLVSSMNGNFFSVAFVSAGVNVVPGTAPIALTTYYPGTPSASANLLRAVVPVACTFPASLTGSKAVCDAAPTSAVTCNITHNGTVVGSVNFAASATSGTFTFSSAVNNAAGDVWAVVAPASPDATFAGPAIALLASAPAVSSNTTLASLGDVNITSPTDGQMMVYSGVLGKWVNTSEDDGSGFVDGNFDFWDVATSVTVSTSDVFVSDMWVGNSGTGGAATVSQVTRTLGSEPSYMTCPNKYQLQWAQTTAASANPTIGEKLEGVGTYNGRTVTVQASLVAAAAGADIVGIRATQYFGTGGSPSASVVTTQTVAWSVTTTEQKFSDTIAIPSISGKTLGTSGTDYLRIDLLMATGTTFTLKYSQLQIDPSPAGFNATNVGTGGVPKAFRYRGQSLERARVSRYLWAIAYDPAGAGVFCSVGFTNASTNLLSVFPLPGMRTGPTLLFGTGSASAMSISNPVGQAVTAVAFTAGNPYSVELNATFATAATVGVSAALRTPGTGTPVTLFADARLTV